MGDRLGARQPASALEKVGQVTAVRGNDDGVLAWLDVPLGSSVSRTMKMARCLMLPSGQRDGAREEQEDSVCVCGCMCGTCPLPLHLRTAQGLKTWPIHTQSPS